MKDYNVMIDGQNFFDQPVKNDLRKQDNIQKIAIGQGDNYTTGCLLDYNYFNNYCKMIPIDLSKQQIDFIGNLEKVQKYFSLLKKQKKQFYIFHKN